MASFFFFLIIKDRFCKLVIQRYFQTELEMAYPCQKSSEVSETVHASITKWVNEASAKVPKHVHVEVRVKTLSREVMTHRLGGRGLDSQGMAGDLRRVTSSTCQQQEKTFLLSQKFTLVKAEKDGRTN